MDAYFACRYVPSTRRNRTELKGGAPALYFFTNGVHVQAPVRINTQQTSAEQTFTVRMHIPLDFRTHSGMEPLLGVTGFALVQTPEAQPAFIHAGAATVPLATLLRLAAGSTHAEPLVIRHTTDAANNVPKGTLFLALAQPLPARNVQRITSQPVLLRPVDVFRDMPNQLRNYLTRAYARINAIRPSLALSRSIRALVWQCQMGALPFAAFWSLATRMPLSEAYWSHLLGIALARFNLTTDSLQQLLAMLDTRERVKDVGRVLSEMLTAYATALPYLTDLYVSRAGMTVIVEWFDYLRLRKSGDCEDKGADSFKLYTEFTAAPFTVGVLVQMQAFAQQYVCSGDLGAVTQPSVGSGVMGRGAAEKLGAHIWCMLTPRHIWAEWRGFAEPAGLPHWLTAFGEMLVCEGTGHMDAVVGSYDKPNPTSAQTRAKQVGDAFFRQFPSLQRLSHSIGLASSTQGHASPFYRWVHFAYAYPMARGGGDRARATDFVQELYFLNRNGTHGVSFDDLARYRYGSRSIQLRALPSMGPALQAATHMALGNMCPEPALSYASDNPLAADHRAIEAVIGAKAVLGRHEVARIQNRLNTPVHRLSLFVPLPKPSLRPRNKQPQQAIGGVLPPIFADIERAVHSTQMPSHGVEWHYEVLDAGRDGSEETHVAQYRVTFYL